MSIEVVNGYVCHSCCDVALAKKGVNPAHPKDDPSNPAYNPQTAKADKAKDSGNYAPAVLYGGALAGLNKTDPAKDASGAASVSGATGAAGSTTPTQAAAPPVTTAASPTSSTSGYGSSSGSPYSPGALLNVSA